MKLQEIFDQLSTGELSQISIGGENQGVINIRNQKKVVNHINLGLAYLFHRFTLRENKTSIALIPDKTNYTILAHDFAKVLAVKTTDGNEFSLNDRKDKYGILTPVDNQLEVPLAVVNGSADLPDQYKTLLLEVTYRATHPKFDTSDDGDIDPEVDEVQMPYAYLEPLLYFVASRVYHPIALNQSGQINMGSTYAARLEQACQRLEASGLGIDTHEGNDRLSANGWV